MTAVAGEAKLAPEWSTAHGPVPMPAPGQAAIRHRCPFCGEPAVLIVKTEAMFAGPPCNADRRVSLFGELAEVKHLHFTADFTCAGAA